MHGRTALRTAIVVVALLGSVGPGSVAAAPLAPATTAITSSAGFNVTQVFGRSIRSAGHIWDATVDGTMQIARRLRAHST